MKDGQTTVVSSSERQEEDYDFPGSSVYEDSVSKETWPYLSFENFSDL